MIDAAWRLLYRLAYPLVRGWWRLTRRHSHGAVVALVCEGQVLAVQPSYRRYLSLPGGYLQSGETALDAACRELGEELGVVAQAADLQWVLQVRDGHDVTDCFRWDLERLPPLRPDRREIVATRLLPLDNLSAADFVPILRPFVTLL
ncbi:hypothetical protein JCM17960_32400 [Magnetospira thiophila]